MAILTEDGELMGNVGSSGALYIGDPGGSTNTDYGGGTVTLERRNQDGTWTIVNDTSSGAEILMQYASGVQAIKFDLGYTGPIRATLTGSTNPTLRLFVEVGNSF